MGQARPSYEDIGKIIKIITTQGVEFYAFLEGINSYPRKGLYFKLAKQNGGHIKKEERYIPLLNINQVMIDNKTFYHNTFKDEIVYVD